MICFGIFKFRKSGLHLEPMDFLKRRNVTNAESGYWIIVTTTRRIK